MCLGVMDGKMDGKPDDGRRNPHTKDFLLFIARAGLE